MLNSSRRAALGCLLATLSLPALAADPSEPELGPDKIQVNEAYAVPARDHRDSADVYASFVGVETNDRLTGADSPACARVELVDGDGRPMPFTAFVLTEDVETGLPPQGTHLKLSGLRKKPAAGEALLVNLHFELGGRFVLHAVVR
jgi:copper(I)-binding protein